MAFTGVMPAVEVIAPRYGLAAGATVVNHNKNDQTWGAGFEQENGLCGIRGETWVWCGEEAATQLTGDEGESTDRWEQVYPFLVQAEDICREVLNARRPETMDRLLKALDFLSIKGAERELWNGESNDESKALNRDANMVGTNLSAKAALGAVEDAMAACLPGVMGTIHIPPAVASVLDSSLQDINGELWTFAGSRVVVGAGYAGQAPGDATHSVIYGTGPVVVHLGPSSMVTNELAQMADVKKNEFALRAERLVAVTFDGCCHVGATVTLS